MIIQFPKQSITSEIYNYVKTNYITNIVSYIINSNYRKSVNLQSWIKSQVDNPTIKVQDFAKEIEDSTDYDIQIMNILRYVRKEIEYTSDLVDWKADEYWQTGQETLTLLKGDCEDGAILIYLLARLKGIPSNRLLLFAGDVNGGGHCWLGYKPSGYPIDYSFIDWCYWYDNSEMITRNKFHIEGTKIFEHSYDNELTPLKESNYLEVWFMFNEDSSYTKLIYNRVN